MLPVGFFDLAWIDHLENWGCHWLDRQRDVWHDSELSDVGYGVLVIAVPNFYVGRAISSVFHSLVDGFLEVV